MQSSHQYSLLYSSPSLVDGGNDDSWSPSAASHPPPPEHHQSCLSRTMYSVDSQVDPSSPYLSGSPTSAIASSYLQMRHHDSFQNHSQSSPTCSEPPGQSIASPFSAQVEPAGGPDRVLTRRQRAALDGGPLPNRRTSAPGDFARTRQRTNSGQHPAMYFPPPSPRPRTPSSAPSSAYNSSDDQLSLCISAVSRSAQLQSPCFPSTPASTSSAYSPYNFFPTRHSRSNSLTNSTGARSASPALSIASALTSVSGNSCSSLIPPLVNPLPNIMSPLAASRPKQRKQRLFNVDRKAICVYHQENPNARQEDIAIRYGVERSTISKILKYKTKWLNVPEHEGLRIAKHRPSKFPEIEELLVMWLLETRETNTVLSDAAIRAKARQTAKNLGIPDDKFKASSGWVENFKHRHGIRRGIWTGDGKNTRAARALGVGAGALPIDRTCDTVLSPLNPAFDSSLDTMDDDMSVTSPEYHDSPSLAVDTSHEHDAQQHDGSLTRLEPGWPTHGLTPREIVPVTPVDSLHHPLPMSHDSSVHHLLTDHLVPPSPHIDSISQNDPMPASQSSQQQLNQPLVEYHNDVATAYDSTVASNYQPIDQGPRPPRTTLSEAEEAINKVIQYLDCEGQGVITDEEREILGHIKCALFSHASGLPYDRPSHS